MLPVFIMAIENDDDRLFGEISQMKMAFWLKHNKHFAAKYMKNKD